MIKTGILSLMMLNMLSVSLAAMRIRKMRTKDKATPLPQLLDI